MNPIARILKILVICLTLTACSASGSQRPYPRAWSSVVPLPRCNDVAGGYFDRAVQTTIWRNPRDADSSVAFLSSLLKFGLPRPSKAGERRFERTTILTWPSRKILLDDEVVDLDADVTSRAVWSCTGDGKVSVTFPRRDLSGEHSGLMTAQTTLELVKADDGGLVVKILMRTGGLALGFFPDKGEDVEWALFKRVSEPSKAN